MRLTRRGWTVVAAVAGAVVLSWRYGPRALNAVVVPLAVVLLAGLVTIARTARPRVTRQPVAEGVVGEQHQMTVSIETDNAIAATVRDTVGDGLSTAVPPVTETTLEGAVTVSYTVEFTQRGRHRVGPLSIVGRDVAGLVEHRFEYTARTAVIVYPRVYELGRGPADDLRRLAGVADSHDHEEFDHLRAYRRGDPLRDIHWKSAAKRPDDDLVVTEYSDGVRAGAVTIAAECVPGRDDELAAAAASVATALLEWGVPVGLVVSDGTQPPGDGRDHHRELLRLLAVTGSGELDDRMRRDADILIRADRNGTTIVADDREIPFDRLRGPERTGRDWGGSDLRRDRDTGGHSGVTT